VRTVLTLLLAFSCALVCGACSGDDSLYSGSWVEPEAPLRLEPGKFSTVSLEVMNKGTATWTGEDVYVQAQEVPDAWIGGMLRLTRQTKPGEVGTFRGNLSPGDGVGLFEVRWEVLTRGAVFGEPLDTVVEVTCPDEVTCG